MERLWRFETSAVHAGYDPDPHTRSVAMPIYQTAAFAFDDTQHSADLFDGKAEGFIYSRLGNPTVQALEQRVNTLEQGVGALALGSGQAAVAATFMTIAGVGDNIVAASSLYGTTYGLLAYTLPQYGIQANFFEYRDLDRCEQLIDDNTKAIFCESIANPSGHVADLAAMAELAHRHGLPLIVDNTIATPYLCRPFEHGADIVVHSMTKYMGGHGATLGGVVVDAGRFPWTNHSGRFPKLTRPDESSHGKIFTEAYGDAAFIGRCTEVQLRTMGAVLPPTSACMIAMGIETLAVRMDRICFNAGIVGRFLLEHPAVSWVSYPALPNHPDHERAKQYMGGRASGVLSFGIKGGCEAGARLQDALTLIRRSTNIGDCKTLVCHPASTTHRKLSPEDLRKSGVSEELVRLSVGIEHIEDLLTDLDQALYQCVA
ncbi:O-acetylhomoserine aminocarboxypropyltransferase/cysteine synthase family protein [Cupriavidus sp. 30B13]|uniref:O-acetylhomoserine aminocarboxypropyltransferase/cysteine synthase family protein n=1 Tax=Cupriavidus sp. 30B13 TaxID=3384241 RepID=UPI003B90D54F